MIIEKKVVPSHAKRAERKNGRIHGVNLFIKGDMDIDN